MSTLQVLKLVGCSFLILKHSRMTTSHLGNRYCGNKTVWKQIGGQLHIFKCIRMITCVQTLQAYLCVQTTTLHEYLHITCLTQHRAHITHVEECYNFKLGCHKSKTN